MTEGTLTEVSESVLRRTMAAVVFGGLMSMLDTTIVNIAIRTLAMRLHGDLPSVQWVVTGYLLALAGVLPLAGWMCDRLGARRVYVWSIAIFTLASVACGLSSSLGALIGFRVLQGAAGALTMPAGSMILVRQAGRARMARVMGTLSIPIVMAPVFGPVVGGLLLEHAGWRWIFFVNLPFGLAAVPLALWLLPRPISAGTVAAAAGSPRTASAGNSAATGTPAAAGTSAVAGTPAVTGTPAVSAGSGGTAATGRTPSAGAARSPWPDVPGLLLISGGSVAATYGLAEAGSHTIRMAVPLVAGVVMLAAFVVWSARISRPLLDVRLYRNAAYAASSLMNFAVGATVFGAMILMPLYYQSVRGLDPVQTGLLVAPTAVGVALTTRLASSLTDRVGSGRTALAGGMIAAAGTVPFVLLGPDTSYLWLSLAGLVRGAGIALVMIPSMAAVYRAIPPAKISDGTTQVNVLNRLGGSTGTAVFTVVLQHALSSHAATGATPAAAATAYGDAFRWVLGAALLAALPALVLARAEGRTARHQGDNDARPGDSAAQPGRRAGLRRAATPSGRTARPDGRPGGGRHSVAAADVGRPASAAAGAGHRGDEDARQHPGRAEAAEDSPRPLPPAGTRG